MLGETLSAPLEEARSEEAEAIGIRKRALKKIAHFPFRASAVNK